MTKYGVSLLSGGLDSTTVTTQAINEVDDITALTFHYNQLGHKEIDCSKLVSNSLGIEHIIIDISSVKDLVNHSSLINPSLVSGSNFKQHNNKPNIPITYVVCNNSIYRVLKVNMNFYRENILKLKDDNEQYLGMECGKRIDIHTIAKGMNVESWRIDDPKDIKPILSEAINSNKPSLLDVTIDGTL